MASEGSFSIKWKTDIDFSTAADDVADAAKFASSIVAEAWLEDSRNFVPVLTGALKDSGRIERQRFKESATRFVFGIIYEMPYALIQHDEEFKHPSLGFFGASRFLTKPFDLNKDFYFELFRLSMKRFLRSRS